MPCARVAWCAPFDRFALAGWPLQGAISHSAGVITPYTRASVRTEILLPDATPDDVNEERSLRPASLDDFIGQPKVRDALGIAIKAALGRREPLDHVLFHGPPGLGKTTLALLMAAELGVGVHTTSGPVIEKPGDLAGLLKRLKTGDILFIDEIHRLRPLLEEFLYPAMEDARIDIRLGEGSTAETMSIPIERFTLVAATTRFGMLSPPMRARFGIVQRLDYYAPEDLTQIVQRSADVLDVRCSEEAAWEIARRSRGTPRVANRVLRRVRDYAEVKGDGRVTATLAAGALAMLEIDEAGLDEGDMRLLRAIGETFGGGPVGLGTLAAALSEDAGTIEDVTEPFLIQQGLIVRTPRGRALTPAAWARLGLAPSETAASQTTLPV
jgi:holliday junction DNA helicase RuvB